MINQYRDTTNMNHCKIRKNKYYKCALENWKNAFNNVFMKYIFSFNQLKKYK